MRIHFAGDVGFNDAGFDDFPEGTFLCPVCLRRAVFPTMCGYTHIKKVFCRRGSDEDETYDGVVVEGTTKERRSALVIVFHCEQGHAWEFIIQQNQGLNYAWAEELEDHTLYDEDGSPID